MGLAQEMAQAHQDARDAVDEAQKELEGSKQKLAEAESSIPGEAHRELRQRVASVEAKVVYLLQVADEREAALSGAQDAVQTAAEELKDLEEQQKLTPKGVVPLDMLVRGELATVSELIDDRRRARTKVLEEAKGASTEWAAKRQELSVSLHTASLQVAAAEDAVEATKQLRKTVAGACKSLQRANEVLREGLELRREFKVIFWLIGRAASSDRGLANRSGGVTMKWRIFPLQ